MISPVEILKERCAIADQAVVADELDISPQYLNDILKGRRAPGPQVIEALGLVKIVTYRKKRGSK